MLKNIFIIITLLFSHILFAQDFTSLLHNKESLTQNVTEFIKLYEQKNIDFNKEIESLLINNSEKASEKISEIAKKHKKPLFNFIYNQRKNIKNSKIINFYDNLKSITLSLDNKNRYLLNNFNSEFDIQTLIRYINKNIDNIELIELNYFGLNNKEIDYNLTKLTNYFNNNKLIKDNLDKRVKLVKSKINSNKNNLFVENCKMIKNLLNSLYEDEIHNSNLYIRISQK